MVKKLTLDDFLKKANLVHNHEYDYSCVNYVNMHSKVEIICKKHGSFFQRPCGHIISGYGCIICAHEKKSKMFSLLNEGFVKRAKEIHGELYDYSKVEYINNSTNIEIICSKHGSFFQNPCVHLRGGGCKSCSCISRAKNRMNNEDDILNTIINIFGNKLDYSKFKYEGIDSKSIFICPKHGEFKRVTYDLTIGKGCPICRESSGEREVSRILEKFNIKFERQKRFEGCRNKNTLPFDFYLNETNACIEFDGEQHIFGWAFGTNIDNSVEEIQRRDNIKNEFCEENGIKLLRILYYEFNKIEEKILEFLSVNKKEYIVREVLCSE